MGTCLSIYSLLAKFLDMTLCQECITLERGKHWKIWRRSIFCKKLLTHFMHACLKGMCGWRFGQFHKKCHFFVFLISWLQGLVKKKKITYSDIYISLPKCKMGKKFFFFNFLFSLGCHGNQKNSGHLEIFKSLRLSYLSIVFDENWLKMCINDRATKV